MKWDKEATMGCLMLLVIFVALGFVLPYASSFGINSENLTEKIFSWIFVAILLLIVLVLFPKYVFYGIAGLVLVVIVFSLFGEPSGACVPVTPGSCD
jgi:hypothetical protein